MIYRAKKRKSFTTVDNEAVRRPDLSLQAKGLLVLMLSCADDWVFTAKFFASACNSGRRAIKAALEELVGKGYVVKKTGQRNGRLFAANQIDVYELSLTAYGQPYMDDDKWTTISGQVRNNNKERTIKKEQLRKTIKEESTGRAREETQEPPKRFSPPALEEVKAYCEERGNGVDAQRWYDYYTSNGWKVGKNPMRDWKAAVRTWERNGFDRQKTPEGQEPARGFIALLQEEIQKNRKEAEEQNDQRGDA